MATHAKSTSRAIGIDGIKVRIDPAVLEDYEVFELSLTLQDEDAGEGKKAAAVPKLLRFVLGNDHERVKRELRARNKGRFAPKDMVAFFARCLEAARSAFAMRPCAPPSFPLIPIRSSRGVCS